MTRKSLALVAAAITFVTTPATPARNAVSSNTFKELTVGVPKQFQGEWRVRLDECPPAVTDRPVWINKTRIRMDHTVGEVRPIRQDDRRNITMEGDLSDEGDPRKATLQLKLSRAENELTIAEGNWKVALKRCPEKEASR